MLSTTIAIETMVRFAWDCKWNVIAVVVSLQPKSISKSTHFTLQFVEFYIENVDVGGP